MVTRRRMFLLKVKLDIVLVDIRRIVFNYIIIYVPTSWYIKLEVGLGIFGSRHVHPLCFYTVAGNGISLLTNCILQSGGEKESWVFTCCGETSKFMPEPPVSRYEGSSWGFIVQSAKGRYWLTVCQLSLGSSVLKIKLSAEQNYQFSVFSFSGFYVCKTAHMQLYNSSICRNLDFICLSGVSSASVPKYTSREFSAGQSSISNLCSQRCLQHLSQSSYAFTETSLMVT